MEYKFKARTTDSGKTWQWILTNVLPLFCYLWSLCSWSRPDGHTHFYYIPSSSIETCNSFLVIMKNMLAMICDGHLFAAEFLTLSFTGLSNKGMTESYRTVLKFYLNA
jgi:hypothetical protein